MEVPEPTCRTGTETRQSVRKSRYMVSRRSARALASNAAPRSHWTPSQNGGPAKRSAQVRVVQAGRWSDGLQASHSRRVCRLEVRVDADRLDTSEVAEPVREIVAGDDPGAGVRDEAPLLVEVHATADVPVALG